MCGSRRARAGSRACATGERSSRGSSLPRGDDPFAYMHVRDERPPAAVGDARDGPAGGRAASRPTGGCARSFPARAAATGARGSCAGALARAATGASRSSGAGAEPDPERPVLFDDEVAVGRNACPHDGPPQRAAVVSGMSRATRVGGLVVRSGRAAHESTFAAHEGSPGTRSLYGEVRCDALEDLQRDALERPRPQVVVKVDRCGLNDNHPIVKALYAAIDGVLRPIVAAEERRTRAHLVRAGGALRARDQVGLRALNESLRARLTRPARPASNRREPSARRADAPRSPTRACGGDRAHRPTPRRRHWPLRFKQALVRMHPGERRGVSLLVDPARIAPGTPIQVAVDPGLGSTSGRTVPNRCAAGGRASPPTCAAASAPSPDRGSACSPKQAAMSPSSSCSSCATARAAGCGRSPARTRTPRSRRISIRRPAGDRLRRAA